MIFKRKKISSGKTLGGRLKSVRKKKKVTLEQAEHITHIRVKYLEALEKGDLNAFPSRIYALGYARRYGEFLGFDIEKIEEDFKQEFGSTNIFSSNTHRPKVSLPKFIITPRLIAIIAIILAVVGIISYVGVSVSRISQPPPIEITAPKEDTVATQPVLISGKTQDTAVVEINGQLVTVDDNGNFTQKVELNIGVNIFEITAKSRLGRQSQKIKKILYNPPGNSPSTSVQ